MVAIGICWEGCSLVYIVPQKSKVNSAYFIKNILTPVVEVDIPRLYGHRAKDVWFHMDSAPAHVAAQTVQWLTDHQVKFIPAADWISNWPDLAWIDFEVDGNF